MGMLVATTDRFCDRQIFYEQCFAGVGPTVICDRDIMLM
jgi:hypothetical protein